MQRYTPLFSLLVAGMLIMNGAACEKKGPAERAGEKIDEGVEKAGERAEEAGEKVKKELEK
ncbi:MAG: hypothetical protein AB1805_07355 [Nitrospirota bacterium]